MVKCYFIQFIFTQNLWKKIMKISLDGLKCKCIFCNLCGTNGLHSDGSFVNFWFITWKMSLFLQQNEVWLDIHGNYLHYFKSTWGFMIDCYCISLIQRL